MVSDPVPLSDLHRVLVVKLRHHGDVLLTSPVFSALQAAAPQVEIDALVYRDTAEMLTLHPAIRQVHTIDRHWKALGPLGQMRAEWGLLQSLRARHYDLILHLTEHRRGAWLARLTGAPWAVAPKVKGRGRFWQNSFTHFVEAPRNALRHTVERNLDALRRIGVYPEEDARRLVLVPGEGAEARVAGLLAERLLGAGGFLHVHPGSRWLFKCWPAEKMAQTLARLQAQGWPVLLTAAPDPRELAMVDAIQARLVTLGGRPAASLAGQLSLKELAAVAGRAKVFLGVDSAPMHIAAAMGTPAVALFGPSGDKEWGPWGVPARVITSDRHPCRPCGIDGCGGGKVSDCLVSLEVERVVAAVQSLGAP